MVGNMGRVYKLNCTLWKQTEQDVDEHEKQGLTILKAEVDAAYH